MLDLAQREKIQAAYAAGRLRVRSCGPDGQQAWKRVLEVRRAEVDLESILGVTTGQGTSVFTAGHRIFLTPTTKVEAESLRPGDQVWGMPVTSVRTLPGRQFMYDLTAEDWHNFYLHCSGLLVSNSPDRNYHFRPPAHEATISQYNQVFGFIWEDEELKEFLERGLDMINASPPKTMLTTCTQLVQCHPEWRTLMLNGAMLHALMALVINWVADEFSLNGGTVVQVLLPDGREVDLPIETLYGVIYEDR